MVKTINRTSRYNRNRFLVPIAHFPHKEKEIIKNFLVCKFCGKANRPKLCENCAFPQNFYTRKFTGFFAVKALQTKFSPVILISTMSRFKWLQRDSNPLWKVYTTLWNATLVGDTLKRVRDDKNIQSWAGLLPCLTKKMLYLKGWLITRG